MKELLQFANTRQEMLNDHPNHVQLSERQQYYDMGKFLSEQLLQEGAGIYILNLRLRNNIVIQHTKGVQHHLHVNTVKLVPTFEPQSHRLNGTEYLLEAMYMELEQLRKENKKLKENLNADS